MSLVSQSDPSACSDEQHNVEVQDKIDTEQDETQYVGLLIGWRSHEIENLSAPLGM